MVLVVEGVDSSARSSIAGTYPQMQPASRPERTNALRVRGWVGGRSRSTWLVDRMRAPSPLQTRVTRLVSARSMYLDLGGCLNYGPLLGPLNTSAVLY